MKALTIVTQDFRQALENALNLKCHASGTLYEAHGVVSTEALACLLERIVVLSHPVYGNSPKLADMALDLHHTEIHKSNVTELDRYIEDNDLLHLEGYTAFRMSNYRHKLDVMMYCLIKKLKLADSLLP